MKTSMLSTTTYHNNQFAGFLGHQMRLIMFIHSPKQTHLGWRKSHQIATWSIFIAVLHWPRLKLPQTSPCSSMACSMYNWQQPVREATAKRAKYVKEPSPSHVVPLVEFTQNMRAGLHAIGLHAQAWQHVFFAQDSCAYFQVLSLHLYWIRDHSIPFDRHYQVCVCVCASAQTRKNAIPQPS